MAKSKKAPTTEYFIEFAEGVPVAGHVATLGSDHYRDLMLSPRYICVTEADYHEILEGVAVVHEEAAR